MRGLGLSVCLLSLLSVVSAQQAPATKMKGFIVTVAETTVTISNVPLQMAGVPPAGDGATFTMPKPKDGEPPPTWVAAEPKTDTAPAPEPKMRMMVMAPGSEAGAKLELTELQMAKGAVKREEFAAGTAVVITYREAAGKKILEKIERAGPTP